MPRELRAGVRLLDPDAEIASLYEAVPALDRNGILQLMLEDSRPWRFAERIVQHVRSDDGSVSLPPDRDLRRLLKASRWLPDRDGRGLAPDAVLICPEQVRDAVADLAEYGAFGGQAASRCHRSADLEGSRARGSKSSRTLGPRPPARTDDRRLGFRPGGAR